MRKARIFIDGVQAGTLIELEFAKKYHFEYLEDYKGKPVSLTLPLSAKLYVFETFPSFFDGLLPEGYQLEGLLKFGKVDRNDYFGQLMAVGDDLVGNITAKEITE